MQAGQNAIDTQMLKPQTMTNSATLTANLDRMGHDYATIRIALGARLNTNSVAPTIQVLESDDTVVTNFATIVANRSESLAAAHLLRYEIDCKSRKRYLRVSISTATATNDDTPVAVIGTLVRNKIEPSGTADMVATTNDAVVVV